MVGSSGLGYFQKQAGGPFSQLAKLSKTESGAFDLPTQAFVVVTISDVIANVTKRLARLLGGDKASAL